MQQLCIEFFWPLTEQMPLDLDYTQPPPPPITTTTYGITLIGNSTIAPSLVINLDNTPITVRSNKEPSFMKKILYKSLGIKWEKT